MQAEIQVGRSEESEILPEEELGELRGKIWRCMNQD